MFRVKDHVTEGKKQFTSYASIEIPEGIDLELAERLLIDQYTPLYNKDSHFQKQQRSLAKLLKIPLEESFDFQIKISVKDRSK